METIIKPMLRFKIALCLILFAIAAGSLPGAARAETAASTVPLNVRSGPGLENTIVDTLFSGERVMVLECRNDWCRITHSGPDGWVAGAYLAVATSIQTWRATSRQTGPDYISGDFSVPPDINVDISAGPGTSPKSTHH